MQGAPEHADIVLAVLEPGPSQRRSDRRGRRRRRRSRRASSRRLPLTGLLAGAVVLAGLAAAVTAATGGKAPRHGAAAVQSAVSPSAHLQPFPPLDPAVAQRATRRRAAAARRRREALAVDRVLRYTPFLASGSTRRRVIALTFDDGPSPYTPAIVATLHRMQAPATFFVVGQQLGYFSGGLRDELRHGFDVGDHTESHAWLTRLSPAGQNDQIRQAATRLATAGAGYPRLFRPPYGVYDATTLAVLRRVRMLMVVWSIDTADYTRPGARVLVSRVLRQARPGAIVLMHDGGGDRSQTVAALPAIIGGLRHRGFRLVSVPQLLALDPPPHRQRLPPSGAP